MFERDFRKLHLLANGYLKPTGDSVFETDEFREQVFPLLQEIQTLKDKLKDSERLRYNFNAGVVTTEKYVDQINRGKKKTGILRFFKRGKV